MSITESVVEQCSLDWLAGLGYEILSGLAIAPGEPAEERADYKQVFLFDRLQTKLKDMNPQIPLESLRKRCGVLLRDALLPKVLSGELRVAGAKGLAETVST